MRGAEELYLCMCGESATTWISMRLIAVCTIEYVQDAQRRNGAEPRTLLGLARNDAMQRRRRR